MQKSLLHFLILIVLVLPGTTMAIPATLSHQGRILDSEMEPLIGVLDMTFSLYDQTEGGQPLWLEAISVAFDNGYYSVTIGTISQLNEEIFDQGQLFLGIQVDHGSELVPRTKITSVPYALRALVSESVIGEVIAVGGLQVGDGLVINELGEWIGPPISYSDLLDTPSAYGDDEVMTLLEQDGYVTEAALNDEEFATIIYVDQEISVRGEDYATSEHEHDYSSTEHGHEDYSVTDHGHDYSPTEHGHEDYSTTDHGHDNYSTTDHGHDDSYYTETEVNSSFGALADSDGTAPNEGSELQVNWDRLTNMPAGFADGQDGVGVSGNGSLNYLAKFVGSEEIGDSGIVESGGNIGINNSSPAATLDVGGGIRLGTTDTCNTSTEGTLRYNSEEKQIELCDGEQWTSLAPQLEADQFTIGLWHMDEASGNIDTLVDSSGFGNHLSRSDASQNVTGKSGKFSSAVGGWSYSGNAGSNLNAFFANTSLAGVNGLSNMTFEFFLFLEGNINGDPDPFGMGDNQGDGNQKWRLYSGNNIQYCNGHLAGSCLSASGVPTNAWVHVALSWDGSTVRLFVNGAVQGSVSDNDIGAITFLRVGAHSSGNSTFSNGRIDEVRLSNTVRYISNFTPPSSPF